MLFAPSSRRPVPVRLVAVSRQAVACPESSAVSQILGACAMIGIFFVMALFG